MAKHPFSLGRSVRSTFGTAHGRGSRAAAGRRRRFRAIERLEERALLTTTLFIDFGEGFNQQLLTTVSEIEQQLGGPVVSPIAPTSTIQLTPLRSVVLRNQIDFVPGGGRGDLTDYLALRESIVNVVRRQYSPFDVNVQVVAARSAAEIRAIMDRNAGDPSGQFDAYVTVTGIFEPSGASTGSGSLGFPRYLGLTSGIDSIATGNFTNVTDNLVVLDVDVLWQDALSLGQTAVVDVKIADVVSREAGHSFALDNTNGGGAPLFNLDVALLNSSDIMNEGAVNAIDTETVTVFTRFPLVRGDGNTNLALTWNAFDILANDPDIGLRADAPAYVTGTGAFDRITINRLDSSTASVLVEAFNDAAFTGLIGTHAYQIVTSRGIMIEAGRSADRIVIDALIGASIDVIGGAGADELEVRGVPAMNASYFPTPTWVRVPGQEIYNARPGFAGTPQRMVSYGGTVVAGATTIRYSEFDDGGAVTFNTMGSAAFIGSEGFDNLTVRGSGAQANEIDGTIAGIGFPNMRYTNVRSAVINTGTSAATDAVTINTVNATGLALLTVLTGAGSDFINVTTANLQFPISGGGMVLNFGSGRDTLNAAADTDWTLSDLILTTGISVSGGVALQELLGETANLIGGPGNNTFRASGWGGVGQIVGQGGTDTVEIVRDLNFSFGENFVNVLGVGGFLLSQIENLRLTGGPSSNTFFDYGWNGTATLNGGVGITGPGVDAIDMIAGVRDASFRLTDTMYHAGGTLFSSTVTLTSIELASLNGGAGLNQFDVSARTTPAAINGGGGQDILIHNRNADVTLTNSSLTVSGPASNFFSLSGIEIAHLTGGASDNTFTISQWAGDGFMVGGGGNDTFNIATGSLDAVAGFWNILGGAGADRILVNDLLGPGGNYVVMPNSLVMAPGTGRRFGAIFFDGTSENLRLNANNGPNRIDVTPSLGTTFTIDGNAPAPPSSDTLVLHTAFTGPPNGPMIGPGAGQRRFTFNAGHRDVIFEDIEQLLGAP